MAYLLRLLLTSAVTFILVVILAAKNILPIDYSHISLAIPAFLCLIFIQAFVMFYFIGVSRLANNIHNTLEREHELEKLFDEVPSDLKAYKKKSEQFVYSKCWI